MVNSTRFEYLITFFIVLNTATMAMRHYNMSDELVDMTTICNYIFSLVFNFEMLLKLIGLGSEYFKSNWNIFDMMIVIMGNIGWLLEALNVNSGGL